MRGAIKMIKVLPVILGIIFTVVSNGFAEKYQLVSEKGKTEWRIVISDAASPSERYAASELQKFLKEISGAELPIVTDKEPISAHEIILGDNAHLRELDVKIDFDRLGKEGFTIRTVGGSRGNGTGYLIIVGSRLRGTLYGVYAFLEKYLGCCWVTWTASHIPKVNQIEFGSIDDTQVPALEYRYTSPCAGPDTAPKFNINGHPNITEEYGCRILIYEGHTFYLFVPPDIYFKDHPEYYSEINGKRVIRDEIATWSSNDLCLTNPDVFRILTENLKKLMRSQPEIDIFSVSQMDNIGGYCRCVNCSKINEREGTPMGSILTFVNKVAEEIEKEFPNKFITTFSYTYSIKPPKTIRPRENVIITFAPITSCYSHPMEECEKDVKFKEAVEGWHKLGAKIYILDYAADFHHYLFPVPNLYALRPNVQFYVKNGVKGIYSKGDVGSPEGLLRVYLLSKLYWSPDYDIDVGIKEFCEGYYGKAAAPMCEYFRMLNDKARQDNLHFGCGAMPTTGGLDGVSAPVSALLTPEVIQQTGELFNEAEKMAANDKLELIRVQATRLGIWYYQLCTMSPSAPEYAEIVNRFCKVVEEFPGEKFADKIHSISEGQYKQMEEYKKKIKKTITPPFGFGISSPHLRSLL